VAKQPPRERQCMACGRKFNSRKTASKHKCPKSKVERVGREAASEKASQATSVAKPDKPPATLTPHAPTASPNIISPPAVTGDSQDDRTREFVKNNDNHILVANISTGQRRAILREEWPHYWETSLWRLG
jgi:predicted RNA-binding Zn-ribbon protein involved in translation (DUF1610 family)